MKHIKDYLHFYLGCEIYVFPPETFSNGWLGRQIERIPDLKWSYTLTAKKLQQTIDDEYFPILRPLSDMTEEDEEDTGLNATYEYGHHTFTPQEFMYFLSKGFDLFGLIESGLAIDKTTLNKQSNESDAKIWVDLLRDTEEGMTIMELSSKYKIGKK